VASQFAPVETPVGSVYVQEKSGGTIYVREKLESVSRPSRSLAPGAPAKIVIVGGGAVGNAAAEMHRREGYSGRITMLSADESAPCDRPNLSKGFLSRAASDETSPLRSGILQRPRNRSTFGRARNNNRSVERRFSGCAGGRSAAERNYR
jgi:glycine/D-amino acid oxidase-like deaminating enzyme